MTLDAAAAVVLAIDTSTTRVTIALGTADGSLLAGDAWPAGHRHGETLMPAIESLLGRAEVDRSRLSAILVGTGPGAFTGLRVGIATAKGLAVGLGIQLVGISTADAILADAPVRSVLLLPAGPADRLLARPGEPALLLPAGTEPGLAIDETLLAVDLAGRAPADAVERGEAARGTLGRSILGLGTARLSRGDADDPAELVPEYVTLPRGVRTEGGEVAWSRDRR